ncbi:MotA/TolQ/ExbB proton channel family protein [Aureliella helgolandensis]|uniref:MotA/TolQ/ExbB proton channel family protein n=1 Tax=Aureliella helgolandensis TaxID=2527968 RepID=A0A518GH24_9BACT|nr:MotA/TolQ/ExbB proton channel family protein [Aureliella helgolandensis]
MTHVNQHRRAKRESYALSLPPVLLFGSIAALTFFGLIFAGPLDFAILHRYCLSHPVAVTSVSLFFVGLAGLTIKWYQVTVQSKLTSKAAQTLQRLLVDGEDIAASQRPEWLAASWQAQPAKIQHSWFGNRISRVIELQINRGRRHQLEADLKSLSEADADRQHESYSLLRIIHWAMPMLGFLGTVLGISQTLGQLDTKMLATQQQDAMNQLTAGLYVAFDTTAIALILTVVSMFLQFGISRLEMNLLNRIDSDSGDGLIGYLSDDPLDSQIALMEPLRELSTNLLQAVQQLTEEQAAIWGRSMSESFRHWKSWSEDASQRIESEIGNRVGESLQRHVSDLQRIQDEGNRQVDLRLQQWQTTLSDQARQLQNQQKEIIRQTDTMHKLSESVVDLRGLEETVHDSVARMENVTRIEEASLCIGEAVAVLATTLERAGAFRTPTRPRMAKKEEAPPETHADDSQPATPSQRKAA